MPTVRYDVIIDQPDLLYDHLRLLRVVNAVLFWHTSRSRALIQTLNLFTLGKPSNATKSVCKPSLESKDSIVLGVNSIPLSGLLWSGKQLYIKGFVNKYIRVSAFNGRLGFYDKHARLFSSTIVRVCLFVPLTSTPLPSKTRCLASLDSNLFAS